MAKYTHHPLSNDIICLAGYYTPQKEVRLPFDGREVLYVVGQAVVETSCCGACNYSYVLVPGYLVKWQVEKDKQGLPVSEVELIRDKAPQDRLRKLIEETERVSQIEFW